MCHTPGRGLLFGAELKLLLLLLLPAFGPAGATLLPLLPVLLSLPWFLLSGLLLLLLPLGARWLLCCCWRWPLPRLTGLPRACSCCYPCCCFHRQSCVACQCQCCCCLLCPEACQLGTECTSCSRCHYCCGRWGLLADRAGVAGDTTSCWQPQLATPCGSFATACCCLNYSRKCTEICCDTNGHGAKQGNLAAPAAAAAAVVAVAAVRVL
jgi:hypothetical protein